MKKQIFEKMARTCLKLIITLLFNRQITNRIIIFMPKFKPAQSPTETKCSVQERKEIIVLWDLNLE